MSKRSKRKRKKKRKQVTSDDEDIFYSNDEDDEEDYVPGGTDDWVLPGDGYAVGVDDGLVASMATAPGVREYRHGHCSLL